MSTATTRLKIMSQGVSNCQLLFRIISSCRCDLCKAWVNQEVTTYTKNKPPTNFGMIVIKDYPCFQTYEICKSLQMLVRLIPKKSPKFAQLSVLDKNDLKEDLSFDLLLLEGSSLNAEYQTSCLGLGKIGRVWMEIFTAVPEQLRPRPTHQPRPLTPSLLKVTLDHGGCRAPDGNSELPSLRDLKSFLVFRTIADCGCPTCKTWTDREKLQFSKSGAEASGKFGVIQLGSSSPASGTTTSSALIPDLHAPKAVSISTTWTKVEKVFEMCWDHTMEMKLISCYGFGSVTNKDFKFTIHGWNSGPVSTDSTMQQCTLHRVSVQVLTGVDSKVPQDGHKPSSLPSITSSSSSSSDPLPTYHEIKPQPKDYLRPLPMFPLRSSSVPSVTSSSSPAPPSLPSLLSLLPSRSMPLHPQSPTTLEVTFRGPKECALVYSTQVDCGCSLCQEWTKNETHVFKKDVVNGSRCSDDVLVEAQHQQQKHHFGVVSLSTGSDTRTFQLCGSHVMKMRLVPLSIVGSLKVLDMRSAMEIGRDPNRRTTSSRKELLRIEKEWCWVIVEVLQPITESHNALDQYHEEAFLV